MKFAAMLAGFTMLTAAMGAPNVASADQSISGAVGGDVITITAYDPKLAGAIGSLTFRGQQYIQNNGKGRSMQSASSFDGYGECFNPTEAGSMADGNNATSSSILQSISTANNVLQTSTNMAFYLSPGQNYGTQCGSSSATTAQNTTVVSNHILSKSVYIGMNGIPNLIGYDINFYVPEAHSTATFEAMTAYFPSNFDIFLSYDPTSKTLTNLNAGPSNVISLVPVIASLVNGQQSMGVMSNQIYAGNPNNDYFGYYFWYEDSAKLDCVFNRSGIVSGSNYSFSCPAAVGNVDEVVSAINGYYNTGDSRSPVYFFTLGSNNFWTASYAEGAGAGWSFKETGFHTFPASYNPGFVPIYRCRARSGTGHFASLQSDCEGTIVEGMFGYIAPGPYANFVPLYRYFNSGNGQHLITTNTAEATGGYNLEGVMGYVPPN